VSSVKANPDSNDVCFFSTNSLESSLRVFLTVHNSVRFCPSRNLVSACDVKKLSVVMLRAEPSTRVARLLTTLALATHFPFHKVYLQVAQELK